MTTTRRREAPDQIGLDAFRAVKEFGLCNLSQLPNDRNVIMRPLITSAIVIMALGRLHPVCAAPCDHFMHFQQIEDGLASADEETRMTAQTCGLASPDRFARGLIVQKLISGSRIDFVISNVAGDEKAASLAATIEPIAATAVTWSEDKKHFTTWSRAVEGSLIADVLVIVASADFGKVHHLCQARMVLAPDQSKLIGPLVCPGVATGLTLQVDL